MANFEKLMFFSGNLKIVEKNKFKYIFCNYYYFIKFIKNKKSKNYYLLNI